TYVAINQYRLRSKNYNAAAARTFFDMLKLKGIDRVLRINTSEGQERTSDRVTEMQAAYRKRTHMNVDLRIEGVNGGPTQDATNITDWMLLARYVFAGKGSPEACQVVLQLVYHWNISTDLQGYADSALGLDCNGFAGNYIWHERSRNPW